MLGKYYALLLNGAQHGWNSGLHVHQRRCAYDTLVLVWRDMQITINPMRRDIGLVTHKTPANELTWHAEL